MSTSTGITSETRGLPIPSRDSYGSNYKFFPFHQSIKSYKGNENDAVPIDIIVLCRSPTVVYVCGDTKTHGVRMEGGGDLSRPMSFGVEGDVVES